MFMQPLPRLVWQARMYLYAHGSRTWQQSCSHVYTAILLWALGSSLAKTRVFTINPKSGRFSGIYYHNIPLPALFCKGGLGGWRCINVLGLCVLTHITPRGSALSHCRTSSLLPARNTWRMLRLQIFPCACTHAGCYDIADLLLHLHTCRM